MAKNLRCLGKHIWRSRGRGDALTYFCQGGNTGRSRQTIHRDLERAQRERG